MTWRIISGLLLVLVGYVAGKYKAAKKEAERIMGYDGGDYSEWEGHFLQIPAGESYLDYIEDDDWVDTEFRYIRVVNPRRGTGAAKDNNPNK